MAWKFLPTTGDIHHQVSAKLGTGTVAANGHLNDKDIGKPVKIVATDTYGLCADGDNIDGFLVHVDPETVDGYAFGTVQIAGRVAVQCDGVVAFGAVVEAAAQAAARTADTSGYGQVSTHVAAAADNKRWKLISGTGADNSIVIIEKQ